MDLILWRHAEAENGIDDPARELTPRGHKQAAQMAKWLKSRLPEDCRMLVSPARRTRQTADALGVAYETTKEVRNGASAADVLSAAGWPGGGNAVLVVGHQPTLGHVAALILSGRETDWTVKKGAVWWFSSRPRHGGDFVLRTVIDPDLL
jgi:phosphohistidine phosphatase